MKRWQGLIFALISIALMGSGEHATAAPDEATLQYVTGSTRRLSQLTGDFDRALGVPTLNQTGRRFHVDATDLGSSFEHKSKLYFLFGDTWGYPGLLDAIAWSDSRDPTRLTLDFHLAPDGNWLAPIVPGIGHGAFEVPSGGISVGGKMYVVSTTDWPQPGNIMGRSVLAVSEDDGLTFRVLYTLSEQHFINVSLWQADDWIYLFGSGEYRKSSVYLARTRASNISEKSQWKYWNGLEKPGDEQWSAQEEDAAALFQHDVVGEFSVAYCEPVQRYVMLYNSSEPRGITMRSAPTPWGPWSAGEVVFEPWADKGYGEFMHVSNQFTAQPADKLSDPNREAEWGGEYGPYIMARFTKPLPDAPDTTLPGCRIFYTLSTWNPYQVMVMQTDLVLQSPAALPD